MGWGGVGTLSLGAELPNIRGSSEEGATEVDTNSLCQDAASLRNRNCSVVKRKLQNGAKPCTGGQFSQEYGIIIVILGTTRQRTWTCSSSSSSSFKQTKDEVQTNVFLHYHTRATSVERGWGPNKTKKIIIIVIFLFLVR